MLLKTIIVVIVVCFILGMIFLGADKKWEDNHGGDTRETETERS